MEKVVLVLLAAGDSRRFHGNKLLHLLHERPMYQYLAEEIETLPEDVFADRIVVTQYKEIMDNMAARGYRVVENHNSELGISHSVGLGVRAAGCECACCFAVCDQPYLKAVTIERLVSGWRKSGKGIGCLCHLGELGNPAVFSAEYRDELLALHGDAGGRKVIWRHLNDLFLYEVPNGIELVDIDTKD